MVNLKKKFLISVPEEIKVYQHSDKTRIVFQSSSKIKILKLNSTVLFLTDINNNCFLYATGFSINPFNYEKTKKLQVNMASCIKKIFSELLDNTCIKLKLVGVGYKVSVMNDYNLLHFKLGYSHSIYFKLPLHLKVEVIKGNRVFISGPSLEKASSFAAFIRSYKLPEPYKGKGILYVNENIKLKIGKKV